MSKRDKPPAPIVRKTPQGAARAFLEQSVLTSDTFACIEWPFDKVKGYGRINIRGQKHLVHRIACERRCGPPPTPQHEAAHRCANASCINPFHLRWATKLQNAQERIAHGNNVGLRGELGAWKLTQAQVDEIKDQIPFRLQREIAADFGVSQVMISRIKLGKAWQDD